MFEGRHLVLLVEDDCSLREVIATVLKQDGFAVEAVSSAEDALRVINFKSFDCVLSDFRLPHKDGIQMLRELREVNGTIPVLIMTAFGSIDMAVEAMKCGANDFISKPFDPAALCAVIRELIDHKRIINRSGSQLKRKRAFISVEPRVKEMLTQARKVAAVDTSVLITGESGTGKELLARFIHENSPQSEGDFIALNCAAIPPELLESELFGHEVGAFTGATQSRKGVFELASGGTLFLDEIADMPAGLQVKLLRALQEREIKRVGGSRAIKVNPRIIAATNHDISAAIADQRLREDLYFRVAVVTFDIPPLRERPQDLEMLTKYFCKFFSSQMGREEVHISEQAAEALRRYAWPGNARELENVMERAVIMSEGEIEVAHLGIMPKIDIASVNQAALSLQEIAASAIRRAEAEVIRQTLQQTSGNKSKAARILKVSYKTMLAKIKEYELGSDAGDLTSEF